MRAALQAGSLAALAVLNLTVANHAMAGPSDYVVTPIVEQGERELDFKAGTASLRQGDRENANSLGFGWGANSWWFTELYAKWHKEPGDKFSFDAWEWENKFQLTETGQYPVDVGFLLEVERPQDRSEGYEYRWGPLFQADLTNQLQANLNLLIEDHVRSDGPTKAVLGYQWQLKYRLRPSFEPGVQGFGDFGPWNDWLPSTEQSHIAGPAVAGRIDLGSHQLMQYNAGLLFALNHAAPSSTLRLQIEYEF
jgi:hypothetical protein